MGKKDRENRKMKYSNPKKVIENKEKGWTPSAYKIPEGVEQFKFKEAKKYRIDVIPYRVKNNPWAEVEKGDYHYERTYFVHQNIGPDRKAFACLQKNFNKPCPICKKLSALTASGASKETLNALRPKERQLFIFIDRDSDPKKIMLFECAHYKSFGEMLLNKLDGADDDSPIQHFHSLEEGSYLTIKTKQDTFQGKTYYPPTNIEMNPRSKPISSSILKEVPCLDDLIIETSYKELEKVFNTGVSDEVEEEDIEDEEEEDEDEDSEDSDDNDSDDDDDDSDDDSEDDDDDDSENDDDDWENKIGSKVTFKKKGKTISGVLIKLKGDQGLVKTKIGKIKIDLDKLSLEDDDDSEDDDDDNDSDEDDWS